MVLPYTVGMFRAFDDVDRIIRAGQKGVPDLLTLLPNGFLYFDAKTGKADFTQEQAFFRARVHDICGEHRVFKLRNVEMGLEKIGEFLNG